MRRGSAQVMANLYKYWLAYFIIIIIIKHKNNFFLLKIFKIIRSVDDIDLFIGGNHEKPLPGAVVGPVLACILAEQARRNKSIHYF